MYKDYVTVSHLLSIQPDGFTISDLIWSSIQQAPNFHFNDNQNDEYYFSVQTIKEQFDSSKHPLIDELIETLLSSKQLIEISEKTEFHKTKKDKVFKIIKE